MINKSHQVHGILRHASSECAVLMIGGSGFVDANYTVDGIPLYADLAERLAEKKMSSLRIEKRSHYETIEEEYLEDVHLALSYLKERYDRVYLLGHSLGAVVAPVFDDVDGYILMAGAVSEVEEIYAAQLKKKADEAQIQMIDEELDMILNLKKDSGFSWFGMKESWWISLDRLNLKERLKALQSPVLVIFSVSDERVELNEFRLYQSYLPSDQSEFYLVDQMNHFFVKSGDQHMHESVVDQIASWILKQSSVIIKKRCCE